ncbi:MAG: hypothetical protein EOP21_11360 [Hyphomicrobiales bacterium]|nr:MAG: hypothetical protein EOP21_11360 [Hyphomicrobiales bacterium]
MFRPLIPALLIGVAIFGATGMAQAKSIKHDVPSAALAAFCTEHGVGSDTKATLSFDNGTSLTGSIHCEAEDLVAGNDDDPTIHDVGDDKGGGREAEAGDDHGSHGDDEAGDDNSGHDESDDDSGEGSDDSGSHDSHESEDHSGHGGGGDD